MPAAAVIFKPAAESDLDNIWLAIAQDNPAAADRMIDAIRQRTEQLSLFPESGPLRPEISDDARCLTLADYLILYRITRHQVEIVRIVHGARDLKNLL